MATTKILSRFSKVVILAGGITIVAVSAIQFQKGSRFHRDTNIIRERLREEGITNVQVNAYAVKNRIIIYAPDVSQREFNIIVSMRMIVKSPVAIQGPLNLVSTGDHE